MAVPGVICPGSGCALAVAWLFLDAGPVVPWRCRRSPFDWGRGGDLFLGLVCGRPHPGFLGVAAFGCTVGAIVEPGRSVRAAIDRARAKIPLVRPGAFGWVFPWPWG